MSINPSIYIFWKGFEIFFGIVGIVGTFDTIYTTDNDVAKWTNIRRTTLYLTVLHNLWPIKIFLQIEQKQWPGQNIMQTWKPERSIKQLIIPYEISPFE